MDSTERLLILITLPILVFGIYIFITQLKAGKRSKKSKTLLKYIEGLSYLLIGSMTLLSLKNFDSTVINFLLLTAAVILFSIGFGLITYSGIKSISEKKTISKIGNTPIELKGSEAVMRGVLYFIIGLICSFGLLITLLFTFPLLSVISVLSIVLSIVVFRNIDSRK